MRINNLSQTDGVRCECGGEIHFREAVVSGDNFVTPSHFRCDRCWTVWTYAEMVEITGGSF